MKIIMVILCVYIVAAQLLSRNGYRFCKRNKECRNLTCAKAKDCKCNSLYNNDNN